MRLILILILLFLIPDRTECNPALGIKQIKRLDVLHTKSLRNLQTDNDTMSENLLKQNSKVSNEVDSTD